MKTKTNFLTIFSIILILSFFIYAFIKADKGNEYKQWEIDMRKSNQLK